MADEDQLTAKVQFTIGDRRVKAEFAVPTGPIRSLQMLPVLREVTGFVVSVAVDREEKAGRKISCAAGCGACCRQMVPIAPSEARQIAELIDALPEPRRGRIRERFRAAVERLTEAGLIEDLRHLERVAGERVTPFGLNYFELGIACPFLEEESCSIHLDRPLACREYLVTSPPEHCADLKSEKVQGVVLNSKVSRILREMDRESPGATARCVPLILASEWAAHHPEESPRDSSELMREFLEHLTGQKLPASTKGAG